MEGGEERRRHARLHKAFRVVVRSADASGQAFESATVLDNFSAGGLYVRLPQHVEPGARLFAVVRITPALDASEAGPCVALHGRVVRVEPLPDGQWGVGVQFTRHRFL